MKKNCFKKCLKENVRFETCYETKKTVMFCSDKDSIPIREKNKCYLQSHLSWLYIDDYVGKIDRNLVTRLNEHASREDQPMYQHLSKCEHFALTIDLFRLPDIDVSTKEIHNEQHFVNTAISNFCGLNTCCNWSQ